MPTTSSLAAEVARLRREVDQIKKGQRIAHGASIENAALEVKDDTGTLRVTLGVQPDGTAGVVAQNGPPPGALSAPIVTPSIAGLRVTWDGTLADGTALPLDFDHVAVHVSTSSGFTPSTATFAGTITRAGDGGMLPVTPLPYAAHYVRLIGVNTSGIGGAPSAETADTPVQVDGPDLTAGSVTAETIAAGAVEADKLAAILVIATRLLAGDPAGARVELNSDGLKVYDASNTLKVFLDATTGDATFTGDIAGSNITGGSVTGATVQTAASGARVTLDTAMKLYNDDGDLLAEAVPDTADLGYPNDCGFVAFNTVGIGRYWAMLSRGFIRFGREGLDYPWPPLIDHYVSGGVVSVLELTSGTAGPTAGLGQAYLTMVGSQDNGTTPPKIQIHGDASGSRCDLSVNGLFTANSMVTGSMNITPSAANTPTSVAVTGLNLPGTVHRAFVTAQSSVPGTVTEVTANNVTANGLTLWLSRTNTTTTNIWYLVVAS